MCRFTILPAIISITSAWSRDEVEKVEKRTNQNSEKTNGKYYGPMRGRYYPPIQAKYSWPFLKNKKDSQIRDDSYFYQRHVQSSNKR